MFHQIQLLLFHYRSLVHLSQQIYHNYLHYQIYQNYQSQRNYQTSRSLRNYFHLLEVQNNFATILESVYKLYMIKL